MGKKSNADATLDNARGAQLKGEEPVFTTAWSKKMSRSFYELFSVWCGVVGTWTPG